MNETKHDEENMMQPDIASHIDGVRESIDAIRRRRGIEHFDLSEIPANGVRSIDLFDSRGRRLFSVSISTDGVAHQVLQAGEDLHLYTTTDDDI